MSQALCSPVPTIRSTTPALGLADRAGAWIASTVTWLAREWQLRQDRRALESLDASALADIGIGPGQAEGAIRHGRSGVSRFPMATPDQAGVFPLMPASWTEWR